MAKKKIDNNYEIRKMALSCKITSTSLVQYWFINIGMTCTKKGYEFFWQDF